MQAKRFILVFLSLFFTYCASAQLAGELMQSRVLILLDGSSSMTQKWVSGRVKYNSAQEVVMRLIDSVYAVNNKVQFGLRMFGHQHTVPEHDCYDTRMEVAFSEDNRSQMSLRLQDIQPVGITPIAFALREAANKDIIDEEHYAYSIILITDGGESCGGDICEVMKTLLRSKVYFKPYIVSLENDPGLRSSYSCMGEFLQVTNDGEIPPAVKTIVDALRPVIKIKKTEYSEIQAITKKKESGHKKDRLSSMDIGGVILFPVAPRNVRGPQTIVPGLKTPVVKIDSADIPKPVNIARLSPSQLKTLNTTIAGLKPKPVGGFELPEVKVDTPRANDAIAKLKPAKFNTFNTSFVMVEKALTPKRAPELPPVKVNPADLVNFKPEAPKREVKVETSNDRETTLEIYFTNGTGTYYTSTPQVLLLDPKTKQVIKKFYRTVDATGNPDPQVGIPPGTYELTLAEKRDFVVGGITVEQDKKKKYYIKVNTASLSFAYKDSLGRVLSRPVSEFVAEVIERNKSKGRVQMQRGTERIQYEPGNYHVEINTLPLSIHNVDLLFDAESVIAIPQPGFLKLNDDGRIASAMIWYRRGDRFEKLRPISPAETRAKPLQLQPGEYQVHYQKGPSVKMKPFRIREVTETVVELD